MTDINNEHIKENGKHVGKTLDWTYIEWHDKDMEKTADAHTQTSHEPVVDKETQTYNPFPMRIELSRTSSRLRCGSLNEVDTMPTPLFQFDRQAPARISTSPTLRRMRSTRVPCREAVRIDSTQEEPDATESSSPRSPLSPVHRQKSPLATIVNQSNGDSDHNGLSNDLVTPGKVRSYRSKTISSTGLHGKQEFMNLNESANTEGDTGEVKEPSHKSRLQERRRSSVVVTLPGLDVSPGDLFVTNGAVDILNRSTFSDTKKSKWPFSKRTMVGRTRVAADIEKCLTAIQIQEWRNTHFQQYKDLTLEEFLRSQPELRAEEEPKAHKRQEALWELFTSECVYFLDQLMVLKEVFLSTLTELQIRECLQDIDSWALFANLNELCLSSNIFFYSSVRNPVRNTWSWPVYGKITFFPLLDYGPSSTHWNIQKFRNPSVTNPTSIFCNHQIEKRELFVFTHHGILLFKRREKSNEMHCVLVLNDPTLWKLCLFSWSESYGSLNLTSFLVVQIFFLTILTFFLENIQNFCYIHRLKKTLELWENKVGTARKMSNYPQNILVLFFTSSPFFPSVRTENSKLIETHLFLFDEFLLITKVKRNKKVQTGEMHPVRSAAGQELEQLLQEGCSFTVLDQPISLDRLQLRNIDQLNATASGLPCSFIIMHQNRYQQCIGVFILQATTESVKKAWLSEIEEAVGALLKQESQHPRLKSSSLYVESSQI
ncbi:pleckstrin-likey domain-containing family G member 7 isoform X1, partial [Silurus asotus]